MLKIMQLNCLVGFRPNYCLHIGLVCYLYCVPTKIISFGNKNQAILVAEKSTVIQAPGGSTHCPKLSFPIGEQFNV